MHKSTKITPVLRKEIFIRWKKEEISQRSLAMEYHVDKRVIGKIIERGKEGDFSVHTSTNITYLKKPERRSRAPQKSALSKTSPRQTKKKSLAQKPIVSARGGSALGRKKSVQRRGKT